MNSDDLLHKTNKYINDFNQKYNLDGIDIKKLREVNKQRRSKAREEKEKLKSHLNPIKELIQEPKKEQSLTAWFLAILLCIAAYLIITNL
uniref:hypothetical protein n=1 Tax=Pedobacter schmidteae TaxID=2201271 RepID=UPI000EB29080|nr:hypothetical protein [Pedobacter schmidteae]